jgi:hypothetical protein
MDISVDIPASCVPVFDRHTDDLPARQFGCVMLLGTSRSSAGADGPRIDEATIRRWRWSPWSMRSVGQFRNFFFRGETPEIFRCLFYSPKFSGE